MLLLLAALLAAPAPLIKPRVWILPITADATPGAGLVAGGLDPAARRVLRTRKALQVVGPGEPRLRVAAGAPDPRVEQAENLRATGRAQLEAGEIASARAALEAALILYEQGLASVGRVDALAVNLAWLGAAEWAAGERKAASRSLGRAAVLAPEEPFEDLPARPRGALRGLQKRARRRGARVAIRTMPVGAEITVDGVPRGRAPVTVRVAAGAHYVQAAHEAAGRAAARVEVRRGTKRVSLALRTELGEPDPAPVEPAAVARLWAELKKRRLSRATRRALATLAAGARANALVLGRVVGAEGGFRLEWVFYDVGPSRSIWLAPLALTEQPTSITVAAEAAASAVAERMR